MSHNTTLKTTPNHKDLLGRTINIDDIVVTYYHNSINFGVVKKINPKMIGVKLFNLDTTWRRDLQQRYPSDVVKLPASEADFTLALLKYGDAFTKGR